MVFSHRVPADHTANRLSALIEQKRARGETILDLTESNPTRCGFSYDEARLLAALASPGTVQAEARRLGMVRRDEQAYIVSGLPAN